MDNADWYWGQDIKAIIIDNHTHYIWIDKLEVQSECIIITTTDFGGSRVMAVNPKHIMAVILSDSDTDDEEQNQ